MSSLVFSSHPFHLFLAVLLFAIVDRNCNANAELVDLSWPYDNNTIYWEVSDHLYVNFTQGGSTPGDFYQYEHICSATHGGTHMDAPRHFHPDRWPVADIPIERMFNVETFVITTPEFDSAGNPYLLTAEDLDKFEVEHCKLTNNSLVLMRSGHSKKWPNRTLYLGVDPVKLYPTLSEDAGKWLAKKNVAGVGLDSPSVDPAGITVVHRLFADRNMYNLENLNSEIFKLPPCGARSYLFPMKIAGASGAPVRVIAQIH